MIDYEKMLGDIKHEIQDIQHLYNIRMKHETIQEQIHDNIRIAELQHVLYLIDDTYSMYEEKEQQNG